MIKNIIMDMGNVLLAYDPYVILNLVCDTEEEKQLIHTHLFEGEAWIMADRGEITNEQRYDIVKEHLPEELHEKLKRCVDGWDICLTPIDGAQAFCETYRKKGYGMYVLSNACNRFYTYFPRQYDVELFDGIMVSSTVRLIKPDRKIYELLCETYELTPQECVFIDDRAENVEAAKAYGMHGIVFDGDYASVERKLQRLLEA